MADWHEEVKTRISALYNMLVEHDGCGEMHLVFKILKKRRKGVITHVGKQYRYGIDGGPRCLRERG